MSNPTEVSEAVTLAIALATFRRPALLAEVLPAVVGQAEHLKGAAAKIIVVDNDPAGSAREYVESLEHLGIEYFHEPQPGIAAARNRALSAAGHDTDVLLFIDDDETPAAGWAQEMLGHWLDWRCAAIAGPVTYQLPSPVGDWVSASKFFSRRERPTGQVLGGAATSNLLLDLRQLREMNLKFDDAFGLSGGSDTMLTHTIVKHGGVIKWCATAGVTEQVPASRARRSWILRRLIRTSNGWSRVAIALAETPRSRARQRLELTARGGFRIARGIIGAAVGLLTSNLEVRSKGECDVASGVGVVTGAFGHHVVEYRRAGNSSTAHQPSK